MTFESAIAFLLALLIWVAIPGPAIFAIIGRSLASGFKPALKLIVGILLGDFFYITVAILGMAAIGKTLGELFFIIKIVGATYLVLMGVRLWVKQPKSWADNPTHTDPKGVRNFLTGFAITLGNPRAILFHLGFLPTFFDLSRTGVVDLFLIVLMFTTVLGSTLIFYAYTAARARMFFRKPHTIRILNRGAGTLLIGAGIAVATRQ
jgi:threonine/homoserine/homoserine lactone efflux protein